MFLNESKLEEIGLDRTHIGGLITSLESDPLTHIKTLALYANGPIVLIDKAPYDIKDKHVLFSIGKSITSIAIGIAVDKGYLSLEDKLVSFFPYKSSNGYLEEVTIEHLLTMTSGIEDNNHNTEDEDWIQTFLHQSFNHQPGTYFKYNTNGSHILSAVLEKVSSNSLEAFVKKYVFGPLAINDYHWEVMPDGITTGGMGLSLVSEDLCKIAYMFANEGIYKGKRIVSKAFINRAIRPHVYKASEENVSSKVYSGQYYGYHIHLGKEACYRFDGAFGQVCLIEPKSKLVVVVTSQYAKLEVLLKHIHRHIIDKVVSYDQEEIVFKKLDYRKNHTLDSHTTFEMTFNLKEHPNAIKSIYLKKDKLISLQIDYLDKPSTQVSFDCHSTYYGSCYFINDISWKQQKYASVVEALSPCQLVLKLYILETPYVVTVTLDLISNGLDFKINKSFTIKNFSIGEESFE